MADFTVQNVPPAQDAWNPEYLRAANMDLA